MYYATAFTLSGYANPLLVESHLGRPTKIEGNNLHPASLGRHRRIRAGFDPGDVRSDRSQAITHLGDVDPGRRSRRRSKALSPRRRH